MELKTHYLETFLIGILQKLLPFLKAAFSNFLNCKVSSKTKTLPNWDQNYFYIQFKCRKVELKKTRNTDIFCQYLSGYFSLELEKNVVIFNASILNFFKMWKIEGADFKYDNSFLKFLPKNTQMRYFLPQI